MIREVHFGTAASIEMALAGAVFASSQEVVVIVRPRDRFSTEVTLDPSLVTEFARAAAIPIRFITIRLLRLQQDSVAR